MKITALLDRYREYDIKYDVPSKTIIVRKPMLVKDYVNMKNIIREYKLDVKDIIIGW